MRVFNRLLSLLLALAMIAAGLWALWISIARALAIGLRPGWMHFVDQNVKQGLQTLPSLQFTDGRVLLTAVALALIGLVLLVLESKPRPPLVVLLDEDDTGRWWLHRATFERALRSSVMGETSATDARARLRGRRSWRLKVDAHASPQLRGDIDELARASLERLGHAGNSSIRVRIRRARRVA